MKAMMWAKIRVAAAAVCAVAVLGTVAVIAGEPVREETAPPAVTGCPIVPAPKEYKETGGTITLSANAAIVIGAGATEPEKYAAGRLQKLVERRFKRKLPILTEDKAGEAGQRIALGQASTNGLVKRLCAAAKIDMAAIAKKSESKEGFAIEAAKGKNGILVAGSNPRGVTYGADAFFDLLRTEKGEVVFPAVSVRDWPSIAWRGRIIIGMRNHLEKGVMDAYVRARINFLDMRSGKAFRPGYFSKSARKEACALLLEAHRRGMFVYGIVSGMGQPEATGKLLEELVAIRVDGFWLGFDDQAHGKDAPEGMLAAVVEMAKKHSIPLSRLATTPSGRGAYEDIGHKWNRKHAKVPGFEQATFFITTPPSKQMFETAKEIGLKCPAGWWHNWPRYDSGLMYLCYGGKSLRTEDKPVYHPVLPLEVGWDHPKYSELRDAGAYCEEVLACNLGEGHQDEYISAVLSLWAWGPARHDWMRTRLAIYAHVFGAAQARAALEFDNKLRQLTPMFWRRPWSGAGAQPPGLKKIKVHAWPPRLKDVKSRPEVLKLLDEMKRLLAEIEKRAPAETMLEAARIKDHFLEPMRATVTYARSMATLDYPEYTMPSFLAEMRDLAFAASDEKLKKRLDEVRAEVTAAMNKIENELGGLKGIDKYVKPWRDGVSGVAYWKTLRETEKQAMHDRLTKFDTAAFADALKDIDKTPEGKVLAELKPGDWKPLDGEALLWRGVAKRGGSIWAVGPCKVGGREVLAMVCANKGNKLGWGAKAKGDGKDSYAEVRAEAAVPAFRGKLVLDVFAGHAANDAKKWPRARFLQVWAGGEKVWESDIGAKSRAGKEWISIDVTAAARGKKKLPLSLRVEDRGAACGHTFIGPVRLRAETGGSQEDR